MKTNKHNNTFNVVVGSTNYDIVDDLNLVVSNLQKGMPEILLEVKTYSELDQRFFMHQNNRSLLFIDCNYFSKLKQEVINHTQHLFDYILILDDTFTKEMFTLVKKISQKNFLNLLDYILVDNYSPSLISYIAKQAILKKIHVTS